MRTYSALRIFIFAWILASWGGGLCYAAEGEGKELPEHEESTEFPSGPPGKAERKHEPPSPTGPSVPLTSESHGESKGAKSEEEDYTTTPFIEYGEFNQSTEEEEDTRFFQFGRFFGVSLGLGFQFVDGNRGALWQGGFPMFDFKVHYWFDFNLAIDLGFSSVSQYYETRGNTGHVDVNMFRLGLDVKYYFDTKNLSAPISFANPYLLAGVGSFSKTENSVTAGVQDQDSSVGISLGGGLEFVVVPRRTFLEIEAKVHMANFKDTYTTRFQNIGLQNLTGRFYTITANVLFTW